MKEYTIIGICPLKNELTIQDARGIIFYVSPKQCVRMYKVGEEYRE